MNRPLLARVVPFALYMAFLAVEQGARAWGGDFDIRWLYPVKVGVVVLTLWHFRGEYRELLVRPARLPLIISILLGVLVFILWINLDHGWLNLGGGAGYDPRAPEGRLDWTLVVFRLAGAALVVPIMEELFWRSFLLRWIERQDFLSVSAAEVGFRAILISSVLFGVEHSLWFAGILAGLAYAWLYRTYNNLWAPITAHATTNLFLGLWVLHTGAWQFW
ncbi:MAG: CAAX prenyl protease-related protein [Pseudomonadota bacterium]|nr:CAAX prenyl protease-related protein [Pseudomonadota bacterium]MDP1902808.1 CAAX prenyl protease-related protein [Pseudomonadota bacterium]MDP2351807.1 CAAX prenyl protease-related protein [Pseudomonadota bacterium]